MATIINNPQGAGGPTNDGDNSGTGMLVGIVVAILLIALFFLYALPLIRTGGRASTPGVPNTGESSGTPGSNVNVNVQVPGLNQSSSTPQPPSSTQ